MGVFLAIRIFGVYLAKKKFQIAKSTPMKNFTTGINTVPMTNIHLVYDKNTPIKICCCQIHSFCDKKTHSHCTFASRKNGSTPKKVIR